MARVRKRPPEVVRRGMKHGGDVMILGVRRLVLFLGKAKVGSTEAAKIVQDMKTTGQAIVSAIIVEAFNHPLGGNPMEAA